MSASRSLRVKEWGGYRRGKPATSQRAGVPLLAFTNFEPKLNFGAGLPGERNLKPKWFIKVRGLSLGRERENEAPLKPKPAFIVFV